MTRILRILWSCVLLLTASVGVAFGQLRSTDDTYVTGANPSTNNGTSTSLVVQAGTSPSYTFIKPDLTPLTGAGVNGSQVQKAYLRIYVTAVTAAGKFDVRQVIGTWTESALSYGSGCGSTSPSNGCYLATTATTIASGVMVNYPAPNSKSQYFDIDITPTLQAWLNAPATNYGVVLVPSSGSSISASFASKEDTTFSHDAEILVVLNPNAAQIVGQISPSQIGPGTAGINVSGYAMTLYSTSQCLGGAYSTGINTSGAAQCSTNGAALMGLNASALTNGTVPSTALSGTYGINISGTAASATTALSANTAFSATNFTGSLLGDVTGTQNATVVSKIGGVSASNFARLDITNFFNGNQNIAGGKLTIAPSMAGYAPLNFPGTGSVPNSPQPGDMWLTAGDLHLRFIDKTNAQQSLAFLSDVTQANSTTLSSANSYTDTQVTAEKNRAMVAETTISGNLAAETSRAQAAESTLTANLSSEVARAQSAEGTLQIDITSETAARQAADATLQNNINIEAASRVASDTLLQSNINAEITARQAADTALQTNINNVSAASAQLTGNNNFSGNNTFTGAGKTFDISAVGTTLPVRVDNTASMNAVCTTQNAMVLNPTQPVGQQLMTCQLVNSQLEWVLVNDEQTLSASVTAETNRAQAAETSITSNLNNEIARAQGAESALTTNLNNEVNRAQGAEAAEVTARALADASLSTAITSETSRATGAEATLQTNINNLSAASAKLNGGNNFTGGEQNLAPSAAGYASLNIPNSSTPPTTPVTGDIWLLSGNAHVNFWDMNNTPQMFAFLSDVTTANSTTLSSANSYTDAQVLAEKNRAQGAESALTTNLNGEINRAQGAEGNLNSAITAETGRAQNAEAGLTLSIANESSRAESVEGTLTANLSNEINRATAAENAKANLAGGNTFTGGKQVLAGSAAGYASLNVPTGSSAPGSAVTGDIWLLSTDPHLQFQDKTGTTQTLAFSVDVTSANANTLSTAESFATTAANNAQSAAQTFATGAANTAQANAETFATTAATTALNSAEAFSSNASNITSGTIGQGFLPADVVYNNQGNTYAPGSKQTFVADSTHAGFSFGTGVSADPSTPAIGDLWYRSDSKHIQLFNGSTTNPLATTAGTLTSGHCATFDANGNIVDNGAACSAGTVTNVTASSPLVSTGGAAPNIALTGIVGISNGGTGSSTAAAALSNLGGAAAVPGTGGTATKITFNPQGVVTGGTTASAGDLSNGTSGSGAIVLATSPALAGTPTAPTATAGTNTTQIATTAFVQNAVGTAAAAAFIKDSSNGSLPNLQTAWIGNNSTGDGASPELNFEFLMGENITYAKFFCRLSATLAVSTTFQVFDSAGNQVSGGSCTIAAGQTSGSSTTNTIALSQGNLYAIKASLPAGNKFGNNAVNGWWALGQ